MYFDGGRRDHSRNSSTLATMDGESGDSSCEPHLTPVPNVDDAENNSKPLDITCVPSEVGNTAQPTDFSFKFNNNLSRFSNFESSQRTIESKGADLSQKEPNRTPSGELELDKDGFRKDGLYRETRVSDFLAAKDNLRDFRNNFNVVPSDSAIAFSKEQHMRASEFAAALSYNKDPHRTSDIAGMILQHHQRLVAAFLAFAAPFSDGLFPFAPFFPFSTTLRS